MKKIVIPWPEFIVLYNGVEPYPDRSVLRLSESFEEGGLPVLSASPALELAVKVYNINEGHNGEIIRQCERLRGYSAFIGKVREFEGRGGEKEGAMKEAVSYYITHGILRDFLKTNSSEVINMLLTEWNWDDALAVRWEEGREEIARNALAKGMSPETVGEITGLDIETIRKLGG